MDKTLKDSYFTRVMYKAVLRSGDTADSTLRMRGKATLFFRPFRGNLLLISMSKQL